MDPDYFVSPAANWYFMIASTFVLTLAGWWTSEKLVEPGLRRPAAGPATARFSPNDFNQSGLGRMLAEAGGQSLGQASLPTWALLVVFVGIVGVFNLLVGSMSAKYAVFAPIFVPMFMMVGISPELTQAAYRIGDSTTNIITPLNPYLIIVLTFMQRYQAKAGIGTLISIMLPYTVVFTIVWVIMMIAWITLGIPLGPEGGLTYP